LIFARSLHLLLPFSALAFLANFRRMRLSAGRATVLVAEQLRHHP
jgi:hypothetical protein